MKNFDKNRSNFNEKRLASIAVPSYIFPLIMSFTPGYFLNDLELMRASYSSIALPSLLSSLLTFALLWRMEVAQKFPSNNIVRILLMVLIMASLGIVAIFVFDLQADAFNILFSSFLGALITTSTQKINKIQ